MAEHEYHSWKKSVDLHLAPSALAKALFEIVFFPFLTLALLYALHSFLCNESSLIIALAIATTSAFAPQPAAFRAKTPLSASPRAPVVDNLGNNIAVKNLLLNVEQSKLLSKVAASGLLSNAQQAGISLSKLEPLLQLAAENPSILVLVEAAGPELLPL